nr:Mce family protein Mce5A [Mycolicibacter nonchromogenicus]
MRTIAEKQAALHDLLTGAQHTVGTMRTAVDHDTDELVAIGTQMTPVVGVLADSAGKFPAIAVGINNVVNNFFDELWTRTGTKLSFSFKLVVALAPLRLYTRSDCPMYGELRGPSCETAPETTPVIDTHGIPDPRSYTPPPGITLPQPANAADRVLLAPAGTPTPEPTFEPGGAP